MLRDVAEELEGDAFPSSHDSGFCSSRGRKAAESDNKASSDNNDDDDNKAIDDEGVAAPLHSALNRAVFLFIVASIKAHVGGNIYTNSLLCFYAVLGV